MGSVRQSSCSLLILQGQHRVQFRSAPRRKETGDYGDRREQQPGTCKRERVTRFSPKNQIYMAWRGIDDDQNIYSSRSSDGVTWDPNPQARLDGAGTAYQPRFLVFNDKLVAIWRGVAGDDGLYYAVNRDGSNWETQIGIPNKASKSGVGLAVYMNQAFMAWRGAADDQAIYWAQSSDGENWSEQHPIGGVGTNDLPSLMTYGGDLYLFWTGIEDDFRVFWSRKSGDADWTPQEALSGIVSGGRISPLLFHIGS